MTQGLELETVELRVQQRVAWITLNRPESLNALTPQVGAELNAALDHVAAVTEARAVVLTGAGRAFSAGADLRQLATTEAAGHPEVRPMLDEIFHPLILRLRELPKPVVAAVNGGAVGFGCALALAADLVLAAESAYFLMAFANIGLTLDGGCSALLVGRIGHARASEMGLLAERVSAGTALEWGLANRVVADTELTSAAAEIAGRLAAGPPRSHAATKRTLNQFAYPRLAEQLELEAALQQECAESEDFLEGVRAFLEKRPAEFTGN